MRGVAIVLAGAVATAAVVYPGRAPFAQPQADPADLQRAKDLYKSAETAVAEGRFDDAARDYGAAYEISKDPVLFFKIASANERAKRCEVAIIYYRRYLRAARPDAEFAKTTNARIVGCGGEPEPEPEPAGSGSAGSAGSGSASAGSAAVDPGLGSGSDAGSALPPPKPIVAKHRTAWLLVGGSLTFVTIGAVLAYSADASESDIADLYVGFGGQPPVFDARTEARYRDLLDEGKRYERLSWLSFGIAGAFAVGAAIKFAVDGKEGKSGGATEARDKKAVRITPLVHPGGAGAAATIRF
jgi:tetratricopeptide (TPR) repeat protein